MLRVENTTGGKVRCWEGDLWLSGKIVLCARNKKIDMRRSLLWLVTVLILTGCSQLDSIPYSPRQTPETWLSIQPFIEFQIGSRTMLLVQPTTTVIVYFLGLIAICSGLYFLRIRNTQRARLWWGIALLLWGGGALFAGTSYEAFSYQIKCAGREACIWTSWWEICYLILSVASVDAMLVAEAYSSAAGKWRKILSLYAFIHIAFYATTVVIGAIVPIKFLISFEWLILVAAPNIVIFLILNGWRTYKLRQEKELVLLGAWVWLVLTIGAYFLYLTSGLAQRLWARGAWFSENDVLHIGLIIWMVYLALVVAKRIEDEPDKILVRHFNP